eukprot:gb/GECH01005461.1/.p1 GENE.gb/GECH01005461.1/~~gb/GECH01005461.1/.p1  ORF type:complete len:708 (+),score=144.19 gb/GECH01005461.1/:1-2124(+)
MRYSFLSTSNLLHPFHFKPLYNHHTKLIRTQNLFNYSKDFSQQNQLFLFQSKNSYSTRKFPSFKAYSRHIKNVTAQANSIEDAIEKLVIDFRKNNIQPRIEYYNAALSVYRAEEPHEIQEFTRHMRSNDVFPDTFTYGLIMKQYLKMGRPDLSLRQFNQIGSSFVDSRNLTIALLAATKLRDDRLSARFFSRLESMGNGFQDPVVINIILSSLIDTNKDFFTIFKQLVVENQFSPTLETYSQLLKAALDIGDISAASEILDMYQASGLPPDNYIFNMLLRTKVLQDQFSFESISSAIETTAKSLHQGSDSQRQQEFSNSSHSASLVNEVTFGILYKLMGMCVSETKKREWNSTEIERYQQLHEFLLDKFLEVNFEMTPELAMEIINTLLLMDLRQQASQFVFEDLFNIWDVIPNAAHMNRVASSLLQQRSGSMVTVLEKMNQFNIEPTSDTYAMLIQHFSNQNQFLKAKQIFHQNWEIAASPKFLHQFIRVVKKEVIHTGNNHEPSDARNQNLKGLVHEAETVVDRVLEEGELESLPEYTVKAMIAIYSKTLTFNLKKWEKLFIYHRCELTDKLLLDSLRYIPSEDITQVLNYVYNSPSSTRNNNNKYNKYNSHTKKENNIDHVNINHQSTSISCNKSLMPLRKAVRELRTIRHLSHTVAQDILNFCRARDEKLDSASKAIFHSLASKHNNRKTKQNQTKFNQPINK